MEENQWTVIDLFAGAGGLSEGFQRQGFDIVSYVEKDKYACETLLTRHIYWELKKSNKEDIYYEYLKGLISQEGLYSYLKTISPVINMEISDITLSQIKKSIKINMKQLNTRTIDIFTGGPPCQAYSLVGRARDPYKMEKDPRNVLYKYYIELLKEFNPKMFIFENVPGILSAAGGKLWKDVQSYFRQAGYEIDFRMLNASDFMVLQKRKRVILIGWRKNLNFSYPDFKRIFHNHIVKDILVDLPSLKPGDNLEKGDYESDPSDYLKKTGIRTNMDILIQHTTRPLNEIDRRIYKRAIKLWKNKKQRLNYGKLPSSLKTHKNQKSFIDRFKVVADDLPHTHTVVAHIAKDGHYYIHPDEKQLRSISVRESARIQSFPDSYKFEGPRTAQLTQIGNAVPPLLAEAIAKEIKEMIL